MTTTSEFAPPSNVTPLRRPALLDRAPLSIVPPLDPLEAQLLVEPVVQWEWQTQLGDAARRHQRQRLDFVTGRHVMLHTDPLNAEPSDIVIANLPGWTESIKRPVIEKMHARLSHELPGMTINTHATQGMDGTITRYTPGEITKQSVEYAADKTFDAFTSLYLDKRVVFVVASMSGLVMSRIIERNNAAGKPLDLDNIILYEPYLVRKERAGPAVLGRLATHVVCDAVNELSRHSTPREAVRLIGDNIRSLPALRDFPMIGRIGLSLLSGSSPEQLDALAAQHPHLIQGVNDCLREPAFEQDARVNLIHIPGKGHWMSSNPDKRAIAIAKVVRQLVD